MPTYGYRCPSCANEFDVWQRMTDPSGATCPRCGSAATRVFYPAGIVFKGSGFYATDSRSASSKSSTAPAAGGSSKSDGAAKGGDSAATPSKTPSEKTSSSSDKASASEKAS